MLSTKYSIVLLLITLLVPIKNSLAQSSVTIKKLLVQPDYVQNGVKGIRLTGAYDFSEYARKYTTDSLKQIAFEKTNMRLVIHLLNDSLIVKPAFGFQKRYPKEAIREQLEVKPTVHFNPCVIQSEITCFIPYAALKLTEGEHALQFSLELSGKDGFNNRVHATCFSEKITIQKSPVIIFELNLDSIVVKPMDTHGQSWDYTLSGTNAPDLDFKVTLGDALIGMIHKGNSYFLTFPEKPRVFRFLISENDEVYLTLSDKDEYIDDPIASWRFNSTAMKLNSWYEQTEAKANLEDFHFRCRIVPYIHP